MYPSVVLADSYFIYNLVFFQDQFRQAVNFLLLEVKSFLNVCLPPQTWNEISYTVELMFGDTNICLKPLSHLSLFAGANTHIQEKVKGCS